MVSHCFITLAFAICFSSVFLSTESKILQPTLDAIAFASEFSSFDHPALPAYRLRIKKTEGFCDPTVNTYTGYLDTNYGTKHLFFYFFESRRNPKDDDVILWINGGPGSSSAVGAFMELGPCNVNLDPRASPNGTLWNPYSWNNHANMFFLDQPIGVGFSHADFGQRVYTTEEASRDFYSFVTILFDTFSEFKGRSFHLAGESYGGHYLPIFASKIYDQSMKAVAAGRAPINLRSVLIGNGDTSIMHFFMSLYDLQCTTSSGHPPVQRISTCVAMKNAMPRCSQMLQAECYDRFDMIGCNAANTFCNEQLFEPYFDLGKNPYDVRNDCEGGSTACYHEVSDIVKWLNMNSTRHIIGADSAVPVFDAVSMGIYQDFYTTGDMLRSTNDYVAQLLERGIRILVYVGETDPVCNWVGNHAWTESLEWSGHEVYARTPMRTWSISSSSNHTAAGRAKSARGLTFLTVANAGHMVPHDKPAEALDMLNRWLADGSIQESIWGGKGRF